MQSKSPNVLTLRAWWGILNQLWVWNSLWSVCKPHVSSACSGCKYTEKQFVLLWWGNGVIHGHFRLTGESLHLPTLKDKKSYCARFKRRGELQCVLMNLLYILAVPLHALNVLPACSVTLSILMSVWVKSCSRSLVKLLNMGFIWKLSASHSQSAFKTQPITAKNDTWHCFSCCYAIEPNRSGLASMLKESQGTFDKTISTQIPLACWLQSFQPYQWWFVNVEGVFIP